MGNRGLNVDVWDLVSETSMIARRTSSLLVVRRAGPTLMALVIRVLVIR